MADLFTNSGSQADLATAQALQPAPWPVAADWQPAVDRFFASSPGRAVTAFLAQRLAAQAVIYPPQPLRALLSTPLAQVRVVILGQDPYHGPGQAEGLAFSVAQGVKIPPSLRNIFKELQREAALGSTRQSAAGASASPAATTDSTARAAAFHPPSHGSLQAWTRQGVLLLNTTLTVEDGQPASHAKQGWEALTDAIIQACAQKTSPVVFMLWGGHAQAKQDLIAAHNQDKRHLVLTANHPSPLSALRPPAPFIGCGHFSAARAWLAGQSGVERLFLL